MIESEEAETMSSTPPSQVPLTQTKRRRDLPTLNGQRRGKSEGKKQVKFSDAIFEDQAVPNHDVSPEKPQKIEETVVDQSKKYFKMDEYQ